MKMRQVLVFTRFAAAVLVLRDVLNTLGGGPGRGIPKVMNDGGGVCGSESQDVGWC